MTFLTLAGAVAVFGLLWLYLPRASFIWTLSLYATRYNEVDIWVKNPGPCEVVAGTLIVLGVILGIIIDTNENSLSKLPPFSI